MNKRDLGSRFEQIAAAFLEKKGYRLLESNFRIRSGEIDLILQDGEYLVFTEVKYRRGTAFGPGEEHVNKRKQQTICRVAEVYLLRHGLTDANCRFDVVAIDGFGGIDHIENAFEK